MKQINYELTHWSFFYECLCLGDSHCSVVAPKNHFPSKKCFCVRQYKIRNVVCFKETMPKCQSQNGLFKLFQILFFRGGIIFSFFGFFDLFGFIMNLMIESKKTKQINVNGHNSPFNWHNDFEKSVETLENSE